MVFPAGGGASQHKQEVVCYLGSWAVYRPGEGKFSIENIDPTLCTTLIYAFVGLNETTNTIKSLDPEYDYNKSEFSPFPLQLISKACDCVFWKLLYMLQY